jgi:hypothetical protein
VTDSHRPRELSVTTATDDRVPPPVAPPPSVRAEENLRRALTLVLADVSSWDQTTWGRYREDPGGACRTAYCLAGHVAVHVLGCPPIWSEVLPGGTRYLHWVLFTEPGVHGEPHTWERDVSEVAAEALQLDEHRADLLFSERNSLRRLVELAYHSTAGRVDLLAAYHAVCDRDAAFAATDAATDAASAATAYGVVARVVARLGSRYAGLPLEDQLGDDVAWWEDELSG